MHSQKVQAEITGVVTALASTYESEGYMQTTHKISETLPFKNALKGQVSAASFEDGLTLRVGTVLGAIMRVLHLDNTQFIFMFYSALACRELLR